MQETESGSGFLSEQGVTVKTQGCEEEQEKAAGASRAGLPKLQACLGHTIVLESQHLLCQRGSSTSRPLTASCTAFHSDDLAALLTELITSPAILTTLLFSPFSKAHGLVTCSLSGLHSPSRGNIRLCQPHSGEHVCKAKPCP